VRSVFRGGRGGVGSAGTCFTARHGLGGSVVPARGLVKLKRTKQPLHDCNWEESGRGSTRGSRFPPSVSTKTREFWNQPKTDPGEPGLGCRGECRQGFAQVFQSKTVGEESLLIAIKP